MMKILFIFLFLTTALFLFSLEISEQNYDFTLTRTGNYSHLQSNETEIFAAENGAPAIPLKSVFFEIPSNKKIASVQIIPRKIETIFLEKPLFPVQKPQALSQIPNADFTPPQAEFYQKDVFPQKLLSHFGSGKCGAENIGYVSFYSFQYFPKSGKVEIPQIFKLEIEFSNDDAPRNFSSNYASETVLNNLFPEKSGRDDEIKYLLITPQQFLDEYQPLLEWRRIEGIETFTATVEDIENSEPGADLQEKIRNYIIDMYDEQGISFVTLGADTDFIPDRKAFAFDCEYGLHDDENDLPCDMYYGCLNGNWDENDNGVFGEEDDDTDYFPEVFVGRISANSEEEVSSYIAKLLAYESGNFADYNTAGGLSMALWTGSDSQVCQQYIYDNYFPNYYDINFLYGAENTTENAFEMLNSNPNFVQHTGHAGTSALSLQNGHIRNSNLDQLDNDFGGVFYSIGCWSAAFDYDSIGENLVMTIDKGMLGYIGNSRYGWGAPSASGFGFSEFYQKEFFKNLFWNEKTILAEGNALQKIPFVPYFGGTSVYKWVAYELNDIGDSYFRLFIDNPKTLDFSVTASEDSLYFFVSSENLPLENVVITKGNLQTRSDANGKAVLSDDGEDEMIYFYKYGYKIAETESSHIEPSPYIAAISGNEIRYRQNEDLTIHSTLFNPTFAAYEIYVEYEFNPDELEITTYENPSEILDFSLAELSPVDIHIKSIAESYQMENDKEIYLRENVFDAETDEPLAQSLFTMQIMAPQLHLTRINFAAETISPGSQIDFDFTVQNAGTLAGEDLTCLFDSAFPEITFAENSVNLLQPLPPLGTLEVSNEIFLSENAPSDFNGSFIVDLQTTNSQQNYSYENTVYLPIGNISLTDDFETDENWNHSPEWQQVSTFAFDGNYSFSCRPQNIGNFAAESPVFVYLPGMELSFQYKYKMPMYGQDGVYFTLNCGAECDTLIFLGAGGALPDERPVPETYIESDWAEYSLDLDEIMVAPPETGSAFTVKMLFKYAEEIEDFNQYGEMDSIGVFVDDFVLEADGGFVHSENENLNNADFLKIFPNPVTRSATISYNISRQDAKNAKIEIYNIKGQRVKKLGIRNYELGINKITWDGKDNFGKAIDSGIYFLRVITPQKNLSRKFIILKN